MIQMVPETGIEPVTLSLEGFCSSTELPGLESKLREDIQKEKEVKLNLYKKILEYYSRIWLFMYV